VSRSEPPHCHAGGRSSLARPPQAPERPPRGSEKALEVRPGLPGSQLDVPPLPVAGAAHGLSSDSAFTLKTGRRSSSRGGFYLVEDDEVVLLGRRTGLEGPGSKTRDLHKLPWPIPSQRAHTLSRAAHRWSPAVTLRHEPLGEPAAGARGPPQAPHTSLSPTPSRGSLRQQELGDIQGRPDLRGGIQDYPRLCAPVIPKYG
jgi:hypothetical protein